MQHRLFLSLWAVIGLAACAPLETYYKPGVAVSTLNRETLACEVSALDQVPSSVRLRRGAPIFIPGPRICDSDGNCKRGRGHYVPGPIERYDPNDGLRFRVERQCMADKGFVPVSIPQCPEAVARAAPTAKTTRLPSLEEGSCVIRNRDGSFQIVRQSV